MSDYFKVIKPGLHAQIDLIYEIFKKYDFDPYNEDSRNMYRKDLFEILKHVFEFGREMGGLNDERD